jgi:hypothetical protein
MDTSLVSKIRNCVSTHPLDVRTIAQRIGEPAARIAASLQSASRDGSIARRGAIGRRILWGLPDPSAKISPGSHVSVQLAPAIATEAASEAARTDRSISWLFQRAWKIAHKKGRP